MKARDIARAAGTAAENERLAKFSANILDWIDWAKLADEFCALGQSLAWPTEPGEPDTLGLGELP